MKCIVTIDVEEEGLFSGKYPQRPDGVKNVRELRRLEFLPRELGFPLTLLVTYPVIQDPRCREVLQHWRRNLDIEIGAHLHPWSTPPYDPIPGRKEPVPSDGIPYPLLQNKLESLLGALDKHLGIHPTAFRMGRFDLGRRILGLIPRYGITVDSSIVPLRSVAGGPDHFLFPADPFRLRGGKGDSQAVVEAPLTLLPVRTSWAEGIYRLAAPMPSWKRDAVMTTFRYLAVVGTQPAWFPLFSMMWATGLHRKRGGRYLTVFLHSSELCPGATPAFRHQKAVERLVGRIRSYFQWLRRTGCVEGAVLSSLEEETGLPWVNMDRLQRPGQSS